MVVFAIISLESVLAVDALLGADKTKLQIAERHAIVGVPAAQHGARDLAGHAADRGAAPNPARRRVADPGLAIGLVHIFDRHAADPVREIVILRGGDRRRQMTETELFQPRQKTFLLLAAKHAEYELGRIGLAAPRHHGQDQAGEESVIEIGDATPSQPLRLLRRVVGLSSAHDHSPTVLVVGASIYQPSLRAPAKGSSSEIRATKPLLH